MADLLQQLQNDDAAGLMYLAGELSPENCAAFERRMTADPVLAAKIDAMRAMEDQVFARIAHLDETAVSTINTAASARQASRVIRQWVVDQARRPAGDAEPQHIFRFPRWSYPLAAAAAIVVAFLVWSTNRPIGEQPGENTGVYASEYNSPISPDNPRVDSFADHLERSFASAQDPVEDSDLTRLKYVEGEAVALAKGDTQATVFDDEINQ
jgi:hypothetical protein